MTTFVVVSRTGAEVAAGSLNCEVPVEKLALAVQEEIVCPFELKLISDAGAITQQLQVQSDEHALKKALLALASEDMTIDELKEVFMHKYGASVTRALKLINSTMKLEELLEGNLDEDVIVADQVPEDLTHLKPWQVAECVATLLTGGALDEAVLCSRFVEKYNVSLASLVGQPSDFLAEQDLFEKSGRKKFRLVEA